MGSLWHPVRCVVVRNGWLIPSPDDVLSGPATVARLPHARYDRPTAAVRHALQCNLHIKIYDLYCLYRLCSSSYWDKSHVRPGQTHMVPPPPATHRTVDAADMLCGDLRW